MSRRMKLTSEPSGVSCLQMDDVKGRNIFSAGFITDFLSALDELERDHRPKVLILSGLPDVFCGGAEKQALLDLCDGKAAVRDLVICERLLDAPFPSLPQWRDTPLAAAWPSDSAVTSCWRPAKAGTGRSS